MPYSFTQIERSQTRIIRAVFWFLIFWYFVFLWLCAAAVILMFDLSWSLMDCMPYVLGAALILGVVHWFLSTRNCLEKALKILKAQPISSNDEYHRRLRNIVEEVSVATGGKKLDVVVSPSFSLNAFSLEDLSGRAVIGVTEGLLARLNRAQLEAVVAQQAAYIVSGDCLSATIVSSLSEFHGASSVVCLEELLTDKDDLPGVRNSVDLRVQLLRDPRIFVFLLFWYISGLLSKFLCMFLSRRRHERADATAVRLCRDPLSLAQALYGMSLHWHGGSLPDEKMEAIFIVNPDHSFWNDKEGFLGDLFSTHPPISRRLKILTDMAHAGFDDIVRAVDVQDGTFPKVTPDAASVPLRLFKGSVLSNVICPRCHGPLTSEDYESVEVLRCLYCRGVLVSVADMPKIILRRDTDFSESVRRAAKVIGDQSRKGILPKIVQDSQLSIICPVCHRDDVKMMRAFYSYAYCVEVDRCMICQNYWFDKDELEILQCLIEEQEKQS